MADFNVAQCLMNGGGFSTDEMQDILAEAEEDESVLVKYLSDEVEIDSRPVRTAVVRAAGNNCQDRLEIYAEYMELLLDSLQSMAGTQGVISPVSVSEMAWEPNHGASQALEGTRGFVAGIVATDDVFLELAKRYSQEELPEIDELAMDSVEEFLNVVNGLFTIQLAKEKITAELGLPASGENIQPDGKEQLRLRVITAFGSFEAVLSAEEFIEQE